MIYYKKISWLIMLISVSFWCAPINAQTFDPGLNLQNLIQREKRLRETPLEQEETPIIEKPDVGQQDGEEVPQLSFLLKQVRFSETEQLTREELIEIISPWLGKTVTYPDLQSMISDINKLYQSKGIYTSTAMLPAQTIKDGTVIIQLVEGKFGQLHVQGNDYTSENYVFDWLQDQVTNKNLDIQKLSSDIQFYNRMNNQQLQAELRAGEDFGLTDIVVNVQEARRDLVQASFDNYGEETTGEATGSFLYQRQKILTDGDRGLLYFSATSGTKAFSGSWNAPVGYDGFRMGGSTSWSETEVVAGDFADAGIEGKSLAFNLESSWMFLSHDRFWANMLTNLGTTESESDLSGIPLSAYRLNDLQLGVQLNKLGDNWELSGRQMIRMVDYKDKVTRDSADKFLTYPGNLSGTYLLTDQSLYGSFNAGWQFSNKKSMPSALSYSLGGVDTIRGYRPGVVSGDSGYYLNLELHYDDFTPIGDTLFDQFLFFDWGQSNYPGTNGNKTLSAIGYGLTWSGKQLSFDLTFARKMHDHPSDRDQYVTFARLSVTP